MLALPRARGVVRENYRGRVLPAAAGMRDRVAALLALAPLAALDELADADRCGPISRDALVYVLGVAMLGLLDDLLGGRAPAGAADVPTRRAAGAATRGPPRAGSLSTGVLKALGALGLALYVLSGQGHSAGEYLVGAGVLVLATNLFNLLDLRPGRAGKALVALGVALTIATVGHAARSDARPVRRARAGAAAVRPARAGDARGRGLERARRRSPGIWLVLTLGTEGEVVALGVLALITLYGEFRSISALVERNPLLRWLDSLGRTGGA